MLPELYRKEAAMPKCPVVGNSAVEKPLAPAVGESSPAGNAVCYTEFTKHSGKRRSARESS